MSKIHLCYVVSSLCNEGPVNVMYNIIKYLDFAKFRVSVITLVPEKNNSRYYDFSSLPINIYQLADRKFLNPFTLFFRLKMKVNSISPDILHTHCPRSMFLVPFLASRYKKVETVHIYPGLQQKNMYGKIRGEIVIFLSHFFTKRMDLPIACSESVAKSYWDNMHFKMIAIPNGCSFPIWKKNDEERNALRMQLGLKDNIKYFIFVGRFSKEKNPDLLIDFFSQNIIKDIALILLGDGELFDNLKNKESDRILLPGFKSDISDYLKAADFYISASDIEGLANTLLESMAIGLPCVLSDIPSHQEVFSKAKKTIGYSFDNRSQDSLSIAIENVLLLDIKSTSLYIQQLFKKNYTAKRMSELYQLEYQNLYS